MDRIKLDNIETSRSEMNDCIRAPTIVLKPIGERNTIYIVLKIFITYQVQPLPFSMLLAHEMYAIQLHCPN